MTPTDEITVRLATVDDATAVADLYTAARVHAVPRMPPALHTNAEDRAYVARRMSESDVTFWVAEQDGEIVGYAQCTPTFLDALYVLPERTGEGIGSLLLDVVDATHPDGYELWVFETNTGARSLYQRRGLVEVERTDGAGNEEKAPDIRMAKRP
ncbi:GNAT family N-acetyltransferase [Nocardioides cynanchi]|uniref:GNAT family N-acetyltransferase n=1 Tax=Nocardioides cynanchi TaxID=2558918 RepID=UPI001245E3F4|nr:GNAT family N-acetyltransferase [Nocardioides cynanchi]